MTASALTDFDSTDDGNSAEDEAAAGALEALAVASSALKNCPKRFVESVAIDDIEDWPGNPKDHDIGAIIESMERNGIVDPELVIDWPDFPHYIISGHGRKKAMKMMHVTHCDVLYVTIDPKAAKRYLLASNRVQERGDWNTPMLYDFLTPIAGDLSGTGFESSDLQDLHGVLNPPTLQDLGQTHGIAGDEIGWPLFRINLPPPTYKLLMGLIANEGADLAEHEALDKVLRRAQRKA